MASSSYESYRFAVNVVYPMQKFSNDHICMHGRLPLPSDIGRVSCCSSSLPSTGAWPILGASCSHHCHSVLYSCRRRCTGRQPTSQLVNEIRQLIATSLYRMLQYVVDGLTVVSPHSLLHPATCISCSWNSPGPVDSSLVGCFS